MDEPSWNQWCDVESLCLRAACNEVLEPCARPIKPRVVSRLVASAEAAALYDDLIAARAGGTAATAGARDTVVALAADPRWRTLVVEHVRREERWADLWHGGFVSGWDWLSALGQKPTDKAHPVARATAVVLLSAGTIGVTLKVAKQAEIELPVRAKFADAAELRITAPPLNVSLAPGQATIAVALEAAPTKLPIQISVEPGAPALQSLADIAKEAQRGNQRLDAATRSIRAVKAALQATNARLGTTPDTSVTGALQSLGGSVKEGVETAKAVDTRVGQIDGKLTDQKRDLRELTEHARDWPASARVVALTSGEAQVLPLWLPDGMSGAAGCNVELKLVRLEKRKASLKVTPQRCPESIKAPPEFQLAQGKEQLLGDLHLVATLVDVDRRLFGADVASVRLRGTDRAWSAN
jgi:hypothetical protein